MARPAHFADVGRFKGKNRKITKSCFLNHTPSAKSYIARFDDAEKHGDVYFCLTQTFDRFWERFHSMPINAHAHFAKTGNVLFHVLAPPPTHIINAMFVCHTWDIEN